MGDHKRICIGNLSYKATEEEVKKELEQYGVIVAVRIPLNRRNGGSKGCAIVDCETPELSDTIYKEIHEKEFLGRICYVSFDDDPPREFRREKDRGSHHRSERDRDRYDRRYERDRERRDRDRHYRRDRRRRYDYYSDEDDYSDYDRYSRRSRRDSPPRRRRHDSPEPRRSREERRERRHYSSEDSA